MAKITRILLLTLPLLAPTIQAEMLEDYHRPECYQYLRGRPASKISHVRDIYVDLAGKWSERQVDELEEALVKPNQIRKRQAATRAEREFPRYMVFYLGTKFSKVTDESEESHQYIFEIPTWARAKQIAAFLEGKLPPVLFDNSPAVPRTTSSGDRKKEDSSSSPAYDPPPINWYPDGFGGGTWM